MKNAQCVSVFVCCVMVSSTITVVSSNVSSRPCTLPTYPTYGTYTVSSDPSAKPGQTMNYFVITVSCRRGYGFGESSSHNQMVICAGGVWSQQMPKCTRFCKLNTHHSMRYECRLPGQGQDTCKGFVPPRTNVIATCKSQFYSANEVEYMTCMEYGIWDRIVSCQAECGIVTPQAELQLAGGRFAKFAEFPWHVGIYDKTEQPYEQICGGSIITSNVVISAAHCFWDDVIKLLPETQFVVATAKLYRKWNDEKDILAQKSEIKKIKIPSLFHGSAASFQQDIAILMLKSPFTYLPYVRPVCHDFNSFFEREQLYHGNLGKVPGWGLTSANGGPSPTLKVADMPFVSEDICVKSVPRSFRAYITGDKFCAGYTNGTSAVCKGDSGGGLVFPALERNKERYYLRGIVSASPRNDDKICNDVTYAAFTKITAHNKFIVESIAESTPMACHSYLFQCNDGSCVYPEAECNGIADCKDGSDESYENCTPGATTTTTTEAPQVCILPPYPEHGRYEVANDANARPGFQADSFVVTVICDSGYRLEADGIANETATPEVYCFDGQWIPELPQCVRNQPAGTNGPIGGRRISERKCLEYTAATDKEIVPLPDNCDYDANVNYTYSDLGEDLAEFPHVAALGWIWESEKTFIYHCGGTLISPRFVVSAGQCISVSFFRYPKPVMARLGLPHINDGMDPLDVLIKKIIPHPDYKSLDTDTDSDIALFELATDVSFQKNIRPACLWSNPDFPRYRNVILPHLSGTVKHMDSNDSSVTLQKVYSRIVDNHECYLQMDKDKKYIIFNSTSTTQMCVRNLGEEAELDDACAPSPGSALQVASATPNQCIYHIVAISSHCSWGKYIYTRVATYIDWIESVVWPAEN